MSLLVAIKDKNRFVVGVDTRVVDNDMYIDDYQFLPKAFHIDLNGEIIVGFVGLSCLADIFKYEIENKITNKTTHKELATEVVPCMREALVKRGYKDEPFEALIAIRDKCYVIDNSFAVYEVNDTYAMGSGSSYAKGILTATKSYKDKPETRVVLSVIGASRWTNTVSNECYLGDTRGMYFSKYKLEGKN